MFCLWCQAIAFIHCVRAKQRFSVKGTFLVSPEQLPYPFETWIMRVPFEGNPTAAFTGPWMSRCLGAWRNCSGLTHRRAAVGYTAAGPRQHIHSWFRVPGDSIPYFTVTQLLLTFQRPTREVKITYNRRSASLGIKPHLGPKTRFLLLYNTEMLNRRSFMKHYFQYE
jgi:hypothetical protein